MTGFGLRPGAKPPTSLIIHDMGGHYGGGSYFTIHEGAGSPLHGGSWKGSKIFIRGRALREKAVSLFMSGRGLLPAGAPGKILKCA